MTTGRTGERHARASKYRRGRPRNAGRASRSHAGCPRRGRRRIRKSRTTVKNQRCALYDLIAGGSIPAACPRQPFIPASSAPPETRQQKLGWHFPSERCAVFQLGLYALQQATHGGNHITKRQTSCVWKFLLIPTPIFFLHMALGNAIKYGRNATKQFLRPAFLKCRTNRCLEYPWANFA